MRIPKAVPYQQKKVRKGKRFYSPVTMELDSSGKPKTHLLYIRKSTNKLGQDDSIQSQNRRIMKYIASLGLSEEDVVIFEDEGVSGYKNIKTDNGKVVSRPRKKFSELLDYVDNSPEPCNIYTYSVSRLGRNMNEGGLIIERLGIGTSQKQKIKEVHICGIEKAIWTQETRKSVIQEAFNKAEAESEQKSEYMLENLEEHLSKNIYPPMMHTPRGLLATHSGLEVTEEMPIIHEAMKRRIKGVSLKKIHEYLIQNGIEYASERTLTTSIFKNSLYIGVYKPSKKIKNHGNIYSGLRFLKGKPPITEEFFNELQKSLGKKSGGYGSKQDPSDVIASLLKFEDNKRAVFSRDNKKGTIQYKANNKGVVWNKSELRIIKQFIREVIPRIIKMYTGLRKNLASDVMNEMNQRLDEYDLKNNDNIFNQVITQEMADKIVQERSQDSRWLELQERIWRLYVKMYLVSRGREDEIAVLDGLDMDGITKNFNDIYGKIQVPKEELVMHQSTKVYKEMQREMRKLDKEEMLFEGIYKKEWIELGEHEGEIQDRIEGEFKEVIRRAFAESKVLNIDSAEAKRTQNLIKGLEKEKNELTANADKNIEELMDLRYPMDYINKQREKILERIQDCEKEIMRLSEKSNIGDFLDELPSALIKIFELSSRVLQVEDVNEIRGALYQLLEVTTFELSVDTKKELKIKLHKGLETLENLSFCSGAPDKNRTCD